MHFILQWIDLIWLPIILLVVHKHQRAIASGFFVACAIMMRLEVELMASTGFMTGMLPILDIPVLYRAIATFSLFYAGFMILCIYSPKSEKVVLMAGSISIFFAASVVSMLVMLL